MATVTMSATGFLPAAFVSGDTLSTSAVSNPTVYCNTTTTFGGLTTHSGGLTLQPANANVTLTIPNATFAGAINIKGSPGRVEFNTSTDKVKLGATST